MGVTDNLIRTCMQYFTILFVTVLPPTGIVVRQIPLDNPEVGRWALTNDFTNVSTKNPFRDVSLLYRTCTCRRRRTLFCSTMTTKKHPVQRRHTAVSSPHRKTRQIPVDYVITVGEEEAAVPDESSVPCHVDILSRDSTTTNTAPPLPPREAPPSPSQLLGLAFVGPSQSGKTSLIQSFLHHSKCPYETLRKPSLQSYYQNVDSTTNTTLKAPTSLCYHKKDVTFWITATKAQCIRLQVWDLSGSERSMQRSLQSLLPKLEAIVLVLSMGDGKEEVVNQLLAWKWWLEDVMMNTSDSVKPVVYVAFHKADLAETEDDDQYARIQLGLKLAHVTQSLNLAQSFLTTSFQPRMVREAFLNLLRRHVLEASLETTSASPHQLSVPSLVQAIPVHEQT